MEQEKKQQTRPMNIFEAINQNIVDMSQDNVAMFELIQRMAVKIDEIHAALYPATHNEIPNDSPKGSGEDEGFENE